MTREEYKKVGRPPSPNKKIQYSTRLPPDKIYFLQGLKNAAKWLSQAIDEKRSREGWNDN